MTRQAAVTPDAMVPTWLSSGWSQDQYLSATQQMARKVLVKRERGSA